MWSCGQQKPSSRSPRNLDPDSVPIHLDLQDRFFMFSSGSGSTGYVIKWIPRSKSLIEEEILKKVQCFIICKGLLNVQVGYGSDWIRNWLVQYYESEDPDM